MKKIGNILRKSNLHYFSNRNHKISFEKMMKMFRDYVYSIIGALTRLENEHFSFNYAKNIPMDEIPDNIDRISEDKTIVELCSSLTRLKIVYDCLILLDCDVKIFVDSDSKTAVRFKPDIC
jgi:hypothetical protein